MVARFYPLKIADVRRETKDCVSIAFRVPSELCETFAYKAGQYVTLRAMIDGEDVRRSYSLCSAPHQGEWRVAIKRVDDGIFSQWAISKLQVGDTIDVMPPDGKFFFEADASKKQHVVAVAAGSGITPMLSILTTLLEREPQSTATLIYGNRRVRDIIFKEAIEDLRDRFLSRFQVCHVLTQEPLETPVLVGRITKEKLLSIIGKNAHSPPLNRAYVCGPEAVIDQSIAAFFELGMAKEVIHFERFTPSIRPLNSTHLHAAKNVRNTFNDATPRSKVTVIADGIERVLQIPERGESILDAALEAGIDAPYACKGAVCCTCRAQVLEGEVTMDANFTLEDHEVKRGFVLTCQAHPKTATVKISYDAR